MNEKIKNFLLHFLIIYVVFIVISSLIKLITYPTEIELNDSEENIAKYSELKKEADLILEDNDCHNAIKEVVKFYETTSINGKINIKDFIYNEEHVPVRLAFKLTENCSQYKSKLDEENIYGKIVANSLIYERIFYKPNLFEYELSIKDNFERKSQDSLLTMAEYNIERKLELEIIRELLQIVKEDKMNEQ